MTDAMIVGDDPVLDSIGAFLAASLLPPPAPVEVDPTASENTGPSTLTLDLPVRTWPVERQLLDLEPPRVPFDPPVERVDPLPIEVVPIDLLVEPLIEPVAPFVEPPVPPVIEPVVVEPDPEPEVEVEASDDHLPPVGRRGPSRLRVTLEWIAIIAGALTVAIVIRVVVIQSFVIPSESMHPTLQANDRVLVNRLAYKAHPIRRGDVIVFNRPNNPALGADTPEHLIKRVIGLPGDTIVERNGVVYIDGRRLREPYLPPGTLTENLNTSITIPAGHVWVMGDNRMNSTDSRIFGAINVKLVVGRAFARVWPISRIGFL